MLEFIGENISEEVCKSKSVSNYRRDDIYHIVTESYSKSKAYKIIEIDLDYDFIGTYLIKD